MNLENIARLTNEELFDALKRHGLSVGPITASTRSVYEKKLLKSQVPASSSQTSINTTTYDKDNIHNLSNDELYEELIKNGISAGPVTPTTRKVYEKKLTKQLTGAKIPGQEHVSSPAPVKSSIHIETNSSMTKSTQSSFEPELINDEEFQVPKIYPKLEFKLLKDTRTANDDVIYYEPDTSSHRTGPQTNYSNQYRTNLNQNFEQLSSKYSSPRFDDLKKPAYQIESSLDPLRSRKPLINLNPFKQPDTVKQPKVQFYSSNVEYRQNIGEHRSIYNEPPPPQLNSYQSNLPVQSKSSIWSCSWRPWLIIGILTLIILFLIINLQSPENENPILD